MHAGMEIHTHMVVTYMVERSKARRVPILKEQSHRPGQGKFAAQTVHT